MAISGRNPELSECRRRKAGARGRPITLADGEEWFFSIPSYRPRPDGLSRPGVDGPTERLFECVAAHSPSSLVDAWEAAIPLLLQNYELDEGEIGLLLSVSPGEEAEQFLRAILEILFGSSSRRKGYGEWVRASLLANGLSEVEVSADDLPDVLSILVATNRTVPLSQFADACREAQSRSMLDSLI